MKKIPSAAAHDFNVMNEKVKKPSLISCSIAVIFIFLFPAALQAQNSIDLNIQGKQYISPTTTPKIPKQFKDAGAGFTVRAGDIINICNRDRFVSKPFSLSKNNKFGGVQGQGMLRPGNCMSLTANNPTNAPIMFWLADEIHPFQKIGLVVLPANWPDEGTESSPRVVFKSHRGDYLIGDDESYWSKPLYTAFVPNVVKECEEGICGTWTREGTSYNAVWSNGAKATLKIVEFDDKVVDITRTDVAASVSHNFYAHYTGKVSGNRIVDGKVEWTQDGRTWSGTWTGSW